MYGQYMPVHTCIGVPSLLPTVGLMMRDTSVEDPDGSKTSLSALHSRFRLCYACSIVLYVETFVVSLGSSLGS